MTSKIVVIGGPNGAFKDLFSKLSKVQSKNNFSLAIITGDLFGEHQSEDDVNALLRGMITVPLPTYFTLGRSPLPDTIIKQLDSDQDIAPNLFFLGRRGTYKTTEGIRIVALGGTLTKTQIPVANAESKYLPTYVESDARALHGAHAADILVTNEWPLNIETGSKVEIPADSTKPQEQQVVSDLATALKPRYHLSNSSSFFYEREPYFHMPTDESSQEKPITRFISLAAFNNPSKQKWLYAFNLDPSALPSTAIPSGVTASPLTVSKKRSALPSQSNSYSRFNGHHHDTSSSRPHKRRRNAGGPQNHGPEECFFCLSNPNIATHMIASIGDESYVTIAKGPLPLPTTYPTLSFPMHMLILPFAHTSTFHDIKDASTPDKTYNEMQRYRHAMYGMISETSGQELGAICWEVSRQFVRHFAWQFLPVPLDLLKRGLVTAAFKLSAEKAGLLTSSSFAPHPPSSLVPSEKGDYFRIWTWEPSSSSSSPIPTDPTPLSTSLKTPSPALLATEKSLILPIPPEQRFDIQFGRKVMAHLLQLEGRTVWQDATQSVEEETAGTERFKELFAKWDFAGVEESGENGNGAE